MRCQHRLSLAFSRLPNDEEPHHGRARCLLGIHDALVDARGLEAAIPCTAKCKGGRAKFIVEMETNLSLLYCTSAPAVCMQNASGIVMKLVHGVDCDPW